MKRILFIITIILSLWGKNIYSQWQYINPYPNGEDIFSIEIPVRIFSVLKFLPKTESLELLTGSAIVWFLLTPVLTGLLLQ